MESGDEGEFLPLSRIVYFFESDSMNRLAYQYTKS
jgi:hypothetical protein